MLTHSTDQNNVPDTIATYLAITVGSQCYLTYVDVTLFLYVTLLYLMLQLVNVYKYKTLQNCYNNINTNIFTL